MIEELKKLIESGQKINKLSITLEPSLQLNELIQLFKEHKVEVSEIEITFPSTKMMNLVDRSKLLLEFIKVLEHIDGLKNFSIDGLRATVKDYALEELLKNKAILKLEKLAFTHTRIEDEESADSLDKIHPNKSVRTVNTPHFFEHSLVEYLKKNSFIQSLIIEDVLSDIKATKYPKLKIALCTHPKLTHFDQGFGSILDKSVLAYDSDVTLALNNKKNSNPEVRIKRLDDQYRIFTQDAEKYIESLNKKNHTRVFVHHLFIELSQLQEAYEPLTNEFSDLKERKERLNQLVQYLKLLKHADILQELSTKNIHVSPYQSYLDRFWDNIRPELSQRILANDKNDCAALLIAIEKEDKRMEAIYKKSMITAYPHSYSTITTDSDEELAKAKKLLNDYTKNNSALSRFFHGHWNRHHIAEVNDIVTRIHSDTDHRIDTMGDLLNALKHIKLVNQHGSLARRIQFIEDQLQTVDLEESSTNTII